MYIWNKFSFYDLLPQHSLVITTQTSQSHFLCSLPKLYLISASKWAGVDVYMQTCLQWMSYMCLQMYIWNGFCFYDLLTKQFTCDNNADFTPPYLLGSLPKIYLNKCRTGNRIQRHKHQYKLSQHRKGLSTWEIVCGPPAQILELKEANHVDKSPRQLPQIPTKHNNSGLHSDARQDGKFPTFDPPKHSVTTYSA